MAVNRVHFRSEQITAGGAVNGGGQHDGGWAILAAMSSIDALVAETGRALSAARRLFGSAPVEGSLPSAHQLTTGRQAVAQVGQAAAVNWQGRAAGAYVTANSERVQAFDATLAGDSRVSPALARGGQSAAAGAQNMDTLIAQTRAGVSALAPSTRSAAGQHQLATYLQGQLNQAKGLLQNYQQQDGEIAGVIKGADYTRGSGQAKDSPPAAPLDKKWKPGDKRHMPYYAGKGGIGPPNVEDAPPWVDVYDRTKDPDQVPHYFVRSDEIPDYRLLPPGSLGPATVYDSHGNPDQFVELVPNSGVWVPQSAFPGARIYPPGSTGILPPYGWEEYLPGSMIYVWHGDFIPEPWNSYGPFGPPPVTPQGGH